MSLTAAQLLYPTLKAAVRGTVTAKAAAGFLKRFFSKAPVRPGSGSKVTKGPLKVGGKIVYGKAGMSTAAKVAASVGAGGVGVATVASHRTAPRTMPSPSYRAPTRAPATTSSDRKCCPAGTKRMVCFKRGRVKKKAHARKPLAHRSRAKKARRSAPSAKQRAARARFAAAARAGKIRKGARL